MADPVPAPSTLPKSDRSLDIPFMVACAVMFGFIGLVVLLVFCNIPAANKDVLLTLSGMLASSFGVVVGYYFSSNATSKAKDATIATLAAAPVAPATEPKP